MCGHRRMPHPARLPYSTNWLIRVQRGIAFGSVAFSSALFLEGRLLPILASINKGTTILPVKVELDSAGWDIELATWEKHQKRRGQLPAWEPTTNDGKSLE